MKESLNTMELFEVGDQPGQSIQKPSKKRSKKWSKIKAILLSTLFIILIVLTAGFITSRIKKNKIKEELKLSRGILKLYKAIAEYDHLYRKYFEIKEINSNKPYVYQPFKEKDRYIQGQKNWLMVLYVNFINRAYNFTCSDIKTRDEFFNAMYKRSWFPPIQWAAEIQKAVWGFSDNEYISYTARWLYGSYCLEEGVLGGADDYLKSCAPKYLYASKIYCMSEHANTIYAGNKRRYYIGGGMTKIINKCTEEAHRENTTKCYNALADYLFSDRYLNYLNNGKQ